MQAIAGTLWKSIPSLISFHSINIDSLIFNNKILLKGIFWSEGLKKAFGPSLQEFNFLLHNTYHCVKSHLEWKKILNTFCCTKHHVSLWPESIQNFGQFVVRLKIVLSHVFQQKNFWYKIFHIFEKNGWYWKLDYPKFKKNLERFTNLRVILAQGPC